MTKTAAQVGREHAHKMGVFSADEIDDRHLGKLKERNRKIVQMVIFDGSTLAEAAKANGCDIEQARQVAMRTISQALGLSWSAV